MRFLWILVVALLLPIALQARGELHSPKSPQAKHARPAIKYTAKVRAVTSKLKVRRGHWKMIICHHSAIRRGNASTYDKEHRRRGMENGLAYHFVIGNGVDSKDGEIEIGPRWIKQLQGGHVRSDEINEKAIGICLVGNFQKTRPTKKQIAALTELISYLRNEVVGKNVKVMTHREADPGHTACPGKYFPTKSLHRLFG
ncbi:MAG TPA: peptidoglycan recognition family protein [Opitutaceae bacterium]|nr:peptidoglycan recognition family protein [Opitutaceae bacterium]